MVNIVLLLSTFLYLINLTENAAAPSEGFLASSSRAKRLCEGSGSACSIVPGVVDEVDSYYNMSINYTLAGVTVDSCKELTPNETQTAPEVSYCADSSSSYLLALSDPDATTPEFLHWMIVNIPGAAVKRGEVLAEYFGPAPPEGTGLHRYALLLFEQPAVLTFDEPRMPANSTDNREGFSIREFAKKYCLGNPIVANIFLAQLKI